MPVRDTLTLEETAKRLKRSPRTLEKWMQKGRLKGRWEQQNGKRERVFDAGDVERIAQVLEEVEQRMGHRFGPLPTIEPAQAEPESVELAKTEAPELVMVDKLMGMIGAFLRQSTEQMLNPDRARLRLKDWLTPRECFLGWGMPARLVVELAEQSRLVGLRYGKSWRIQRKSLEAFGG